MESSFVLIFLNTNDSVCRNVTTKDLGISWLSYETELMRINHFTCYKAPYSIMVGTLEVVQINPKESTYTKTCYTPTMFQAQYWTLGNTIQASVPRVLLERVEPVQN